MPEEKEALLVTEEYQEQMSESTFLFLTLDLPTAPLYKDEKEQLIIPQVPLFNILAKFNGNTEKVPDHTRYMPNQRSEAMLKYINVPTEVVVVMDNTFSLILNVLLPQKYKISHGVSLSCRSTKPTRRIFSRGFSWPNFLHTSFSALKDSPRTTSSWRRIPQSSTSPSRTLRLCTIRTNLGDSVPLGQRNQYSSFNRNVDLREYLTEEAQVSEKNTTYDLVANIVHDGKPTEGAYRIHVLHHVCYSKFLF